MISVIITVCGNAPERRENFEAVMSCLSAQRYTDFQIVLVEQVQTVPYYNDVILRAGDKYQQIWRRVFNLSWCRNVGARLSSSDILLLLDSDMVFGSDYLSVIDATFDTPYALGWNKLTRLTKEGRKRYFEERDPDVTWSDSEFMRTNLAERGDAGQGGANIFRRKWFFEKFGGYCEDFENWGAEDCEAMNRAEALTGSWKPLEYSLIHLWHGASAPFEPKNQDKLRVSREDPLRIAKMLVAAGMGNVGGPTWIFPSD